MQRTVARSHSEPPGPDVPDLSTTRQSRAWETQRTPYSFVRSSVPEQSRARELEALSNVEG